MSLVDNLHILTLLQYNYSGPMEEMNIRAIFAGNQDKVVDDYFVSQGEANLDDMEEQYNQQCIKVVSD